MWFLVKTDLIQWAFHIKMLIISRSEVCLRTGLSVHFQLSHSTSNLAGHHRMSMTLCFTSSLLDLCASQNVPSLNVQQPVKLSHLLSGEPLCLTVHFISLHFKCVPLFHLHSRCSPFHSADHFQHPHAYTDSNGMKVSGL